jgi:hypothetical protein
VAKLREFFHSAYLKTKTASEIPRWDATAYIRPEKQANRIFLKGGLGENMKRLFGVFSVLIMLLSFMACAEMQPKRARQVYDEINQINMELPRRMGSNTTLERVSYDDVHSVLVCHYTVDTWDRANVVAEIQSLHLFCDMLEQEYRDHLFSMVDKIKYEYNTADGWMQYAFVADKTTCK